MFTPKLTLCLVLIVAMAAPSLAQDGAGLRAGLGTDITGGIAFGAALNYTLGLSGPHAVELGIQFYRGSFEEDSNNGFNDYHEETTVGVFAVSSNYLINYSKGLGTYVVVGAGAGAFSVEWTESSPTDTSLGAALPGGGSTTTEDGTSGGTMLNVGIGRRFSEKVDFRIEAPVFLVFTAPGEAASVVPTLTVTGGIRF